MERLLQTGDRFSIKSGMKFYSQIPAKFVYANYMSMNPDTLVTGEIRAGEPKTGNGNFVLDTSMFIGDYVVLETKYCGGGMCHDGFYPNGHKIMAQRADDPRVKIEFYQTGFFTCMIDPSDITLVR